MTRPNILLIVMDTARADRFSCYGYQKKTTPNIDKLAREGTVFLHHYAAANKTIPSHTSIFTGIHPYFHGAATNSSCYDGRYPTLQEILGEQGYQTIGLSYNPYLSPIRGITRGFQRYHKVWEREEVGRDHKELQRALQYELGYELECKLPKKENPEGGNENKKKRGYLRTLVRQFERYLRNQIKNTSLFSPVWKAFRMATNTLLYRRELEVYRRRLERYERIKGGKAIIDLMKEEIRRCKQENSNFYIFANLLEPHWPYLPPKRYKTPFLQDQFISRNVIRSFLRVRGRSRYTPKRFITKFSPEDWAIISVLYDAGMLYTDALLGELFSFMEAEGIMDNTVLIITSDHGELLGEHRLISHGISLYEPLIRTPLIIRYPERFKRGYIYPGLTQSVDLFPTILGLTNARADDVSFKYKGINLYSNKLKEVNERFIVIDDILPKRWWFAQQLGYQNTLERAIITDKYKYIWCSSGRHRLHNIKEDPQEERNLYTEAAYKPVVEDLQEKMVKWYQEQLGPQQDFVLHRYDYARVETSTPLSGAQEEELKKIEKLLIDLGYMPE